MRNQGRRAYRAIFERYRKAGRKDNKGILDSSIKMRLRDAIPDDLLFLHETERRFAELGFVHSDDVSTHLRQMDDPDYAYYIVEDREKPAHYVILRGLTSSDCSRSQVPRAIACKAFTEFRAHRLWLDVFEDNHRARHVCRSVGFVEQGTRRECMKNGGRIRSLVVMSLLKDGHRQNDYQPH